MGLSLQTYSNLLTTCSTALSQVTDKPLLANTQRLVKILVEQGASFATNTIVANTTAAQLNACTTFLKAQVISLRQASLCFVLGAVLIIIQQIYEARIIKPQQTSSNEQPTSRAKYVSLALGLSAISLFFYGAYKIYNFSSLAQALLTSLEKPSALMNKDIKQIETMRDIFLVDGLYKNIVF